MSELFKQALKTENVKQDVQALVEKKIENIKPAARVLKDILNIEINFPSAAQINNYVEKVCKALSDTKKKGDNIQIDNLITATYKEPTARRKPN